tara:strand:- start:1913 stop:2494 length:582 start_codon:yes stop_codon:yes gene_type:complete
MMISLNIFTKCPFTGNPKTRMSEILNLDERRFISKIMIENILQEVSKLSKNIKIYLWVYPNYNHIFFKKLKNEYNIYLKIQYGKNLAERMEFCLKEQSKLMKKTLLIGSDLPTLNLSIINDALNVLKSKDYVVGPSKDGGFYLLGFNGQYKDIIKNEFLFYENIVTNIKNLSLSLGEVKKIKDIDYPNDLLTI